ncbi:MAG: hypothetical protein QOF89_960 [Acidobacteriota bacterium]|jgi:hypothetical protein|nr:hypothetical protein [Acidobacteriota bacterium]
MEENRKGYDLKAPGRLGSGPSVRLPGRSSFPGVDDHLVVPEVTRDEIIDGRRVVAHPAKPPHAKRHFVLDHVLQAHLAAEYVGATDLLTRHDVNADFATDSCVYKDGVDPAAGTRYLEEIAFEVVSEQKERDASEKALQMHRRGVRRIFAIFLKSQRVCEWSAESQSWLPLDRDSEIADPCLVTPLPVAALLDGAAAAIAVVKGLAAQGNPELQRREAAAEARGKADAVLKVLAARGIAVSEEQRQEILLCRDLDCLDRWLYRAVLVSSTVEVISEP